MENVKLMSTVMAILIGGTAVLAAPVDDLVAQLEAEGYTEIEVEIEDGVIEIEGVLDGMEREIEIDAKTGEILSDVTEAEDDDDDEDDDHDEDDDDDEEDDGDD